MKWLKVIGQALGLVKKDEEFEPRVVAHSTIKAKPRRSRLQRELWADLKPTIGHIMTKKLTPGREKQLRAALRDLTLKELAIAETMGWNKNLDVGHL